MQSKSNNNGYVFSANGYKVFGDSARDKINVGDGRVDGIADLNRCDAYMSE